MARVWSICAHGKANARRSFWPSFLMSDQEVREKLEASMRPGHAVSCSHCKNVGKPRQLNELLQFDRDEPVIALCNKCLHSLKYADAHTWKWFREYRDRLIKMKTGQRD
jgi:hypothetical protein